MNEPSREACLKSLGLELRNFVGGVKKAIDAEIRAYPTPIPRCDAQFNFLYELSRCLARILARTEAGSTSADPGDLVDTLAQFAASAPLTEDVAERTLRERISAALSRRSAGVATPAPTKAGSLQR